MTHPIESWDIAIPSLGIYSTLTKTPSGQWTNVFGTSGVMRMTYFGQQNKKRIPRFDVCMVSNDQTYVLCTMDIDGNWLNAKDEILDVSLTPTMWTCMRRLDALESSAYANVNAAIQSLQETEKRLTERVVKLEEQLKQQSEYFYNLVLTQQQHCAEAVKKSAALEATVAELEKNLRALHDTVVKDVVTQMSMSASTANFNFQTKAEQLEREIEAVREKMHYSFVKRETDQDNEAAEQNALLKGTLGTCLLQQSEMQQSIVGLTKSVNSLQQDLTNVVAKEVVDLSPEITAAQLEPGEAQCRCNKKRVRR